MKSRHGQRLAGTDEPKVAVDDLAVAVACVFIPHFPLRVEILRHPELDGLPLALTDLSTGNRRAILEASPEAQEHGVRVGMPRRYALR